MQWIKTNDPRHELPKDEKFLALWKGCICLVEWDDEDNHFYASTFPASSGGIMRISHERMEKFTHYCKLKFPEDY